MTVALGTGGRVDLYNQVGSTDVIADVVGFYAADTSILNNPRYGYPGGHTIGLPAPIRPLDTRSVGGAIGAGQTRTVAVNLGATVSPQHVHALLVNVTAVTPKGSGYLTLWDSRATQPGTSTLNYTAGTPAATNFAMISVTGGSISVAIFNGSATPVNVILDVFGYTDDTTVAGGLAYHPITPVRIVDSRSSIGVHGPLTSGGTVTVTTPAGVGSGAIKALSLNVTAISPTIGTYLTLFAHGVTRPNSSNLNPAAGKTVANAAFTLVNTARQFDVYNNTGSVDVVIDVGGYYLA